MEHQEFAGIFDGEAKVRVGKSNGLVQIIYTQSPDAPITLQKATCPPYIQAGVFRVRYNPKDGTIYGMAPWVGLFDMLFKSFGSSNGEVPAPKLYEGGFGPYQGMTALFEITEKPYAGMIVSKFLYYKFAAKGNFAITVGKATARSTQDLREFLEVTGADNNDIPYSDNLLPEIQKRALRAHRIVKGSLKDGYIDKLIELPNQPAEAADDDDWGALAESDEPIPDPLPASATKVDEFEDGDIPF